MAEGGDRLKELDYSGRINLEIGAIQEVLYRGRRVYKEGHVVGSGINPDGLRREVPLIDEEVMRRVVSLDRLCGTLDRSRLPDRVANIIRTNDFGCIIEN